MKRQHAYEQIIGRKLNAIAAANTDISALWNGMETLLDQHLPQEQKSKRGAGWFGKKALLAMGLTVAAGLVYALCQLAPKEPPVITDSNVPAAVQELPANGKATVVSPAPFLKPAAEPTKEQSAETKKGRSKIVPAENTATTAQKTAAETSEKKQEIIPIPVEKIKEIPVAEPVQSKPVKKEESTTAVTFS